MSHVEAANAFVVDNRTVCTSQKLYDMLIQAALDCQGATCKGSSMHASMIMQHDAR